MPWLLLKRDDFKENYKMFQQNKTMNEQLHQNIPKRFNIYLLVFQTNIQFENGRLQNKTM